MGRWWRGAWGAECNGSVARVAFPVLNRRRAAPRCRISGSLRNPSSDQPSSFTQQESPAALAGICCCPARLNVSKTSSCATRQEVARSRRRPCEASSPSAAQCCARNSQNPQVAEPGSCPRLSDATEPSPHGSRMSATPAAQPEARSHQDHARGARPPACRTGGSH